MRDSFRHFAVEPLADGVWAAVHRTDPPAPDAWAVSNAGIVDLGDGTLVLDTFLATAAAAELRAAAEELTGRPPTIAVLSHAHNDHAWGAGRFPEATLVATTRARATLAAEGREEIDDYRDALAERLAFWSSAADGDDPVARADAPFFLPYWLGVAATLPGLDLRLPDVTVEGTLEIHGTGRRAVIRSVDRAHTDGDLVLTVPDAGVVFCGDLLFVGCHPYLGDGDIRGLRAALAVLVATGADRLVPGHGPVGTASDAAALMAYLDEVERSAVAGVRGRGPATAVPAGAGGPEPEVAIPDAYRSWGLRRFFAANVAFAASTSSSTSDHAALPGG